MVGVGPVWSLVGAGPAGSRVMTSGFLFASKLPVRNSLIGWVTKEGPNEEVATKEEEEWACPRCTLINRPSAGSCDACLATRVHVPREQSSSCSSLIKFPCTSFSRPAEELKVNWRSAFGTTTLIYSDLTPPPPAGGGAPGGVWPAGGGATGGASPAGGVATGGVRRPAGGRLEQPTNKKMRIDEGRGPGNSGPGNSGPGDSAASGARGAGVPCCAAHRRPSSLRSVHKDGQNKGRRFYCCSLPREAQCTFFQWADLDFPECNHGRRSIIRTVLKLGANNGRSFYVCGSKMGKQCEFFQWAESSPPPWC